MKKALNYRIRRTSAECQKDDNRVGGGWISGFSGVLRHRFEDKISEGCFKVFSRELLGFSRTFTSLADLFPSPKCE